MKNKKNIKLMAMVFVLLIIFIFSIINSFVGNPITATIATNQIRTYVNETYPSLAIVVPKATYNFKNSDYYSLVESKISEDMRFSVSWKSGEISDDYKYEVANKFTTYRRLQKELDTAIEKIIANELPYETAIVLADFIEGDGGFSSLTRDMPFDISNPPLRTELTIHILSKDISYEALSSCLIEVYNLMERNDIPIDLYSIALAEPYFEGEKPVPGGEELYLYDFPVENITDQNLIEVMKQHQEEWELLHEK